MGSTHTLISHQYALKLNFGKKFEKDEPYLDTIHNPQSTIIYENRKLEGKL